MMRENEDNDPMEVLPAEDHEPIEVSEADHLSLPDTLPILPVRDIVLYPHVVLPLAASTPSEEKLINDVSLGNRLMAVAAVKNEDGEEIKPGDIHEIGCGVMVLKMMRFPDSTTRILVQGVARIRIKEFTQTEPYIIARVERIESDSKESVELEALAKSAVDMYQRLVDMSAHMPAELKLAVLNISDRSRLADVISTTLNLSVTQRQELLKTLDVRERLRLLDGHLNRELNTAELSSEIQSQVRSELDGEQRDYFLRRQLKAIQAELGEGDEQAADVAELRERVEALDLPEDALKEAERELDRLGRMPPQASEYHVARTYLEWIIALPWNRQTRDKLDIDLAEKILNDDHYDLDKVKERILEYLAVRKLKRDARGPILCFVGPPGTGKTSLGRSIARALGRKFARISLGGVRDEAEIRGHRRTYVGALPGRIIQGLRKVDTRNPVFMLDEIDKLRADFQGDPAAALLEVLDPEQNSTFTDHYMDVPFDLSRVMFITTANVLDTIPAALLDRMEVLELPGYTLEEKVHIAERYLIPRQLKENGLKKSDLELSNDVVSELISGYTREAGLRNLERSIGTLCRKHAASVARQKGKRRRKRILTVDEIPDMLGVRRYEPELADRTSEPGVATGMAWTPSGGEILFIECTRYQGPGKLLLTGKLGAVMKESAHAALSYIQARASELKINSHVFANANLHIHVPAGAIPKDGPSAGVTMAVSLISLFTGTPVRPDVAMTGEITLRGRVLPVGGVKEKLLAAHRAGIKTVILPKRNEKDIAEVPDSAKKGLKITFAETLDEVLPIAFDGNGYPHKRPKAAKKRASKKPANKKSANKKIAPKKSIKAKPAKATRKRKA
jgi:ATP-dependent Lon protease